jgi:hypothetical protein
VVSCGVSRYPGPYTPPRAARGRPRPAVAALVKGLNVEDYKDIIQSLLVATVTGAAGYTLAAFKKASKTDLADLERRIEAKLRERQVFLIEPLKSQLASIETRLSDCITARELDSKFTALERRLDDIVALIARRGE